MSCFQANLMVLKYANPSLFQRLDKLENVNNFEIFMDEENVVTLNFVNKHSFLPLYEDSPLRTIESQMQECQKLKKYPYLFFYGIANGSLIKCLLEDKEHKRTIVIEPELEILYVVLHMIDFSCEIDSKRLVIFDSADIDFPNVIGFFLKYPEHRYAKIFELQISAPYYEKIYFEDIQRSNRVLIEAIYHAVNIAGNDTVDALVGLKHHIVNFTTLIDTPPLFELMNKLHTCNTAVLVSTGPSLTKQLPLLKKIAPFVRIIAVDASFPVLYNAGIKPDVVVSIERVKESARFFSDMPKEAFEGVVFALSSVQHKDVVESIKGGTIQMSLRPLDLMMYSGPEEWGYIGIGQSAANMAYELIYHSKFENCILIGQDLAYDSEGKSHAQGHVFGQENTKMKETDIWIKGWKGIGQVRTNHSWDMFRKSFEKDIGDTKANMITVNATEGGASIYGALEIPFHEAIKKYVDSTEKKIPLSLKKAAEFEKEKVQKRTREKIKAIKEYVQMLLEESKIVFLDIADAAEVDIHDLTLSRLKELVHKVEAIKDRHGQEEIYDKVVWHIAQSTMLMREVELATFEVLMTKNNAEEKERLWQMMQLYKPWLFLFAGILNSIVKTIEYSEARTLVNTVQKIDVYIKDDLIDCFTCKELKPNLGRVFDVDVRGILYDFPDEFQEKIDEAIFKDAKTKEDLPKTFVDVIKRDDEKYNELSFMKSLEAPIDTAKIADLYCPHAIGFLATEENLNDKEFVRYIKALMVDFPKCTFKALYLNSKIPALIRAKFETDSLEMVLLFDIWDIFKHVEVYMSNYERSYVKDIEIAIVKYLRENSSDVMCIGLGLNQQKISIREHENKNPQYFCNFFDHLDALGFSKEDSEKYGHTFHEIYYKKASEHYGVEIDFNLNESVSRAYVYWNLKLGLKNHQFFKNTINFSRQMLKFTIHE